MPLSELRSGDLVDGVVTAANRFGVFVDFGGLKDGRLSIPWKNIRDFRVGDQLRYMSVDTVDLQRQKVVLAVSDLPATLEHLWQERAPLADLHEGMAVAGVVCGVGRRGVFVNIGATKDGLLRAPMRVQLMMFPGKQLHGLRIQVLDLTRQRLVLTVDAESSVRQPWPAPAAGGSDGSKRKPPPSPGSPDAAPIALEDVRVGELADGVVVSMTPGGAKVDIGATWLGALPLSAKLRQRFRIHDTVEGMVVQEVDLRGRQIILFMDDPELAVLTAAGDSNARSSSSPKRSARPKAGTKRTTKAQPS